MSADLCANAVDYATRGWPVFPVNPATNRPLIRSAHPEGDPRHGLCKGECEQLGHGFHDATIDPERVRQMWGAHPRAAIGVRTGIAVDVLDIDHESFEIGVVDLPDCEVVGPSARSGGGHWHLYVRPTGLRRRIRFSTWCDWLGTNGYVIVPPSPHKSGGTYSWIVSPDEVELSDAPALLIDAVAASNTVTPSEQRRSKVPVARPSTAPMRPRIKLDTSSTQLDRTSGWSADGLIDVVVEAVEGERNARLNWAAHRIGRDVADGRVDQGAALDALARIADAAEAVGLGVREVDATITSGYRSGSWTAP